jgi:hypothetical protein
MATLPGCRPAIAPAEVVEEPGTHLRDAAASWTFGRQTWPLPVRIDLFGDEVESLRSSTRPASARSALWARMEIGPGSEALGKYGPVALATIWASSGGDLRAAENVAPGAAPHSPLLDPALLLAIREEIRVEVPSYLAASQSFHGIEWYLPYFYRPGGVVAGASMPTDAALDRR